MVILGGGGLRWGIEKKREKKINQNPEKATINNFLNPLYFSVLCV